MWAVKVSVARCQPIGLMQVVRREGNMVVSAALERDSPQQRNSNMGTLT